VPCLFLSPVAAMVPPFATAPVLILVGALMFRSVGKLDLSRLEDARARVADLVRRALDRPTPRRATRPSRAKARIRVEDKRKQGQKKVARRGVAE